MQPRSAECGDSEILQAERRGEPESLVLRPVAHRRMLPAAPPAFLHRFPFFRALTQRCFRPIPRILRAAPRFVPCSAFPFRTALVLPDVRACRFSLHSVIPLVLQRGGSENPSAPGKTDCRAAGVYFGGIDFELRCFNNEIRGKSADRARAAADSSVRSHGIYLTVTRRGISFPPRCAYCVPPLCRTRRRGIEFRWKNNVN